MFIICKCKKKLFMFIFIILIGGVGDKRLCTGQPGMVD